MYSFLLAISTALAAAVCTQLQITHMYHLICTIFNLVTKEFFFKYCIIILYIHAVAKRLG